MALLLPAIALLSCAFRMGAERLPVRTYTTADGLILDGAILQIIQDSRGFLWFVTDSGISRFDGQSFQNLDAREGLRSPRCILESTPGVYWIGTLDGLVFYNPLPSAGERFQRYQIGSTHQSNDVEALANDGAGGLWIGTRDGLYRAKLSYGGAVSSLVIRPEAPPHTEPDGMYPISHLLRDSRGALWAAGTYSGVYRISSDGRVEHYTTRGGLPLLSGGPFLEDHLGRIWLATPTGLLNLRAQPGQDDAVVLRWVRIPSRAPEVVVRSLCRMEDGHLWLASHEGLFEFDGDHIQRYTRRNGLALDDLWAVLTDREGNLWVGTDSAGVMRINRKGLTSLDESDGVDENVVAAVTALSTGEVIAITRPAPFATTFRLHVLFPGNADQKGPSFKQVHPLFSREVEQFGWGDEQVLIRDHLGETWVATFDGIARFPPTTRVVRLNGAKAVKLYTIRDGLLSNNIYSLFEDSKGDIWIGLMFPPRFGMQRWIRSENRFEDLTTTAGALPGKTASSFLETRSGSLWIGDWPNGLTRFRNGRFQSFDASDGLPGGEIRQLYMDPAGILWGAVLGGGLLRIDHPDTEKPQIVTITESDGLSTNDVTCVAGDSSDGIYVGTFRGVDHLDSTGAIRHFTSADGLASNIVLVCTRDRTGYVWFGTKAGLSRMAPQASFKSQPAVVRISSISIRGRRLSLSDLGETGIHRISLPSGQNSLQIAFASINFAGATRYRYKMEGAREEWQSTRQQTVDYPALPPGEYRFLVQAVSVGGEQFSTPAVFSFAINPPIWKRWWFLALIALTCAGCIHVAWRYRMHQMLQVERVRMRIATDLHDDIGSALSQISLLSEVARGQVATGNAQNTFSRIATVSRETAASMADIVWTVNPERDSLGDLSARVRRFAGEFFAVHDIDCVVVTPESDEDLKLDIDTRRQLLLIAKEAMHNVIRHAQSKRVRIELRQEARSVVFWIEDNGVGFDPDSDAEGHGLSGMRIRAERLGGKLRIESRNGCGTKLEFRVPI